MTKNVAIEEDSINQVKVAIVGTDYTQGKFYAIAATEKIERDGLQQLPAVLPTVKSFDV